MTTIQTYLSTWRLPALSRRFAVFFAALLAVTALVGLSSIPEPAPKPMVKRSIIPGNNKPLGSELAIKLRKYPSASAAPAASTSSSVAAGSTERTSLSPSQIHLAASNASYDPNALVSLSTSTGRYFLIYHEQNRTYNPNIIPHPTKPQKWITVTRAKWVQDRNDIQLVCVASFKDDALVCEGPSTVLDVDFRKEGNCNDDFWYMNGMPGNQGPRDARVFWGPDHPYVLYNALGSKNCLGLWLQNARYLLEPFRAQVEDGKPDADFAKTTELQRPDKYGPEEKNFFVFWDNKKRPYVHHDIAPNRVFAALNPDGSVGEDLGPQASALDQVCMNKLMPQLGAEKDHVHQGTNALSITLCKRDECTPDVNNTFIMHVFQRKTVHRAYSQYEPYAVLFRSEAPFNIHAIAQEPLWVHGRSQKRDPATHSLHLDDLEKGQDDFLYATSMSWKTSWQTWHGYLDDVLFLTFGVHDGQSGGTDVEARYLLSSLAYC